MNNNLFLDRNYLPWTITSNLWQKAPQNVYKTGKMAAITQYDNDTLTTRQKQWLAKQLKNNDLQLLVPSLPAGIFIAPEVCHVSCHPQSDWHTLKIGLWLSGLYA